MVRKLLFSILPFLFVSCSPVKKEFRNANYSKTVHVAAKRILKGEASHKDVALMDMAYGLANQTDRSQITYLSYGNNPKNYDDIIFLYERLKARQSEVRFVTPITIGDITYSYEYVDYDKIMYSFKQRAAKHLYEEAKKILKSGQKKSHFRKAYNYLSKVKEYVGLDYKNLEALSVEAKDKGVSKISVGVINATESEISPKIAQKLLSFGSSSINDEWKWFYISPYPDDVYDYQIQVKITDVRLSKNLRNEKVEEINGGSSTLDYAVDSTGHVMQDEQGNKIRISKHTEASCKLIEYIQSKTLDIGGQLILIEGTTKKVLREEPFAKRKVFTNSYYAVEGDKDALTIEQKQKLTTNKPKPYPSYMAMMEALSEGLKRAIRTAILQAKTSIK